MKKIILHLIKVLIIVVYSLNASAIFKGERINDDKMVVGISTHLGDCGGVFISESVILTAAHCVTEVDEVIQDKKISISLRTRSNSNRFKIKKIIKNAMFKMKNNGTFLSSMSRFDLAEIFLDEEVASDIGAEIMILDNVKDPRDLAIGSQISIIGFGLNEFDNTNYKSKSLEVLKSNNYDLGLITLSNENIKSTLCPGDSGGVAFVIENGLVKYLGLLSAVTKSCGSQNQTGYLSPLFLNLEWIKDTLIQ